MKGVASVLTAAVRESFRVGSSRLSVDGRSSDRESYTTRREFSTKRGDSRRDVSTRRAAAADVSTPEASCEDGEEQYTVNGSHSNSNGAGGGSSSSKPSVGNVGRLMRQMTVVSKAAALSK